MGGRILNVPYRSQYDVDAALRRSDCGPACLAMILGALGRTVSTHTVAAAGGNAGDSGLRPDQIVSAAGVFGLDMLVQTNCTLDALKRLIDSGQPPIALIDYGKIPDRWDQKYTAGYFVVVVGYDDVTHRVFISDPGYPPGAMGYQRPYSYQAFLDAWGGFEPSENHNRSACLIVPQPRVPAPGTVIAAPPTGNPTPRPHPPLKPVSPPAGSDDVWVVAPPGLVLRQQATLSAEAIAHLVFGQHLTALSHVLSEGEGAVEGSGDEPDSDPRWEDARAGATRHPPGQARPEPSRRVRPWRHVRTDAGVAGWVTAALGGVALLSQSPPDVPRPVQVLDTPAVRDAGGLSVRKERDFNVIPLDRVQIGERLTVYASVVAADGSTWLLAQSPRGRLGWVREHVGSLTLVARINLESAAALDTSMPTPAPGAPQLTPSPEPALRSPRPKGVGSAVEGSGDVWVIAPAGLALRAQPDPAAQRIADLSFGQRLSALGAESAPDAMGRTWQPVRTANGSAGFVVAGFRADRYLSNTQPPSPFAVQVLDTRPMREAGGLAVHDKRDFTTAAAERVPIGESLIVYSRVTEADGGSWLWVRSPRGRYGWAREKLNGTLLVGKLGSVTGVTSGTDTSGATRPVVDGRPFGKCLSGLGMAAPQPLTPRQLALVAKSQVEAFKILTLPHPDDNTRLIQSLRDIPSIQFIIARLFFAVDADSQFRFSPQVFVDTVFGGTNAAYQAGVRYFEVHNEPNLESEGMGWNWADGAEFAAWLTQVIAILRQRLPGSQFGFPGLSPQPNVPAFLDGASSAIGQCDWVGVHCYWQSGDRGPFPMTGENAGMYWRGFRDRYPDKLLMITEFSNNSAGIDPVEKGRQYAHYYQLLRREPNLGAAFAFALSWPGQDVNREGWEIDGIETAIPGALASLIGQPGFLA